jgi:hypothetical protein
MAVHDEGLVVRCLASREKKISLESSIFKWLESFCRLGLMLNCLVSQAFVFIRNSRSFQKRLLEKYLRGNLDYPGVK